MLFLNPEQPVVRESPSALRGQQGHSLSQHDPGPAAQVKPDILGLRTTPSTNTPSDDGGEGGETSWSPV